MFCRESLDELTVWHRDQKLMAKPYWTAGLLNEVENNISDVYNLREGIAMRLVVSEE